MSIELFDILDESGKAIGTASRAEAHSKGLWHGASSVFVFPSPGVLLIQQRHLSKDVCPGAWDVSVAEHLQPGESFEQAALRGLKEELGIEGIAVKPLGGINKYRLELPSVQVIDYEFQQSFTAQYSGDIFPDASEILTTRTIRLEDLRLEMQRDPDVFTPWFLDRVKRLRLFH